MINLLRGEVYKLQKCKYAYICCIAMVAFVLLLYGTFLLQVIQQGEVANAVYEEFFLNMAEVMFGGFGSIIAVIFVFIFVYSEYANGAIKNIVGKGYVRWKIFGAKYLSAMLTVVIMQIIMGLTILVFDRLCMGQGKMAQEIYQNYYSYAGIQILMGAALTGIMIVINQMCRSLGTGIAVNICVVMFSSNITSGIDAVLSCVNCDVTISDYWIPSLISNCSMMNIDSSFGIRTIILSMIWIVLAFGIGTLHFEKTDVK